MERILRTELEIADKRIIVLESTIDSYRVITKSLEDRIEAIEISHKLDIKLNYTKNK